MTSTFLKGDGQSQLLALHLGHKGIPAGCFLNFALLSGHRSMPQARAEKRNCRIDSPKNMDSV